MTHEDLHEPLADLEWPDHLSPADQTRLSLLRTAALNAGHLLLPGDTSNHLQDWGDYLVATGTDSDQEAGLVEAAGTLDLQTDSVTQEPLGSFLSRLTEAVAIQPPRSSVRAIGRTTLANSVNDPSTQAVESFVESKADRPNILLEIEERVDPLVIAKLRAYAKFAHRMEFDATTATRNFNPDHFQWFTEKLAFAGVELYDHELTEWDLFLIIADKYSQIIADFPDSYEDNDCADKVRKPARPIAFILATLQRSTTEESVKRLREVYSVKSTIITNSLLYLSRTFATRVRDYETQTGRPAFQSSAEETAPAEGTTPEEDRLLQKKTIAKSIADQLREHTGQTDRADRDRTLAASDMRIIGKLVALEMSQESRPESPEFMANVRRLMSNIGIVKSENATEYIPDYETAKRILYGTLFFIALDGRDRVSMDDKPEQFEIFLESLRKIALWANGTPDHKIFTNQTREKAHANAGKLIDGAIRTIKYGEQKVRTALLEQLQEIKAARTA
jgi:hypothetical protein